MEWLDANNELPSHANQVLIKNDSIFKIAVYSADDKAFLAQDGTVVVECLAGLMWAEIDPPAK